ncbi:hypothetical protein AKO1_008526, partial [Acrasis kona]
VSFTRTPTEQEILLFKSLIFGVPLGDITKGNEPKFKNYWLDDKLTKICWEKVSLEKSYIKIQSINAIVEGPAQDLKDIECLKNHPSFHIVTKKKTYSFAASEPFQKKKWMDGLQKLIEIIDKPKHQRSASNTLKSKLSGIFSKDDKKNDSKDEAKRSSLRQSTKEQNIKSGLPTITPRPSSAAVTVKEIFNTNQSPSAFGVSLRKTGELEGLVRKDDKTTTNHSPQVTTPIVDSNKLLFEFVVVVKLESSKGGPVDPNTFQKNVQQSQLNPVITYTFPPSNVHKKQNKGLMLSIPSFCFPDIDLIEPLQHLESKTYSFVLTDLDGSRRFGYCRRMLPTGKGLRWPETYCIISSHPCFEIFNTILNAVEVRNQVNNVAVFSFLKTVLSNPFPERGTVIQIKAQTVSGAFEQIKLERPNTSDLVLEHINFNDLFTHLKLDHILWVFASVMLERRLLFFSNDISVLSSVTHALVNVIYPFTWQHVFIPVLPKSLIDYVCSPVPFVVGVLSIHKSIVDTMPMEEVLFVDLDHDKITGDDDRKVFPEQDKKTMEKALKAAYQKDKPIQNKDIVEIFLQFFLRNFGCYRKYLNNTGDGKSFDSEAFLKSKSKSSRKFFEMVSQSQMYERWCYDLELGPVKTPNESEQDVFEIRSKLSF